MKLRVLVLSGSLMLNGACFSALVMRPAFAPAALRDFFSRHFQPEAAAGVRPLPRAAKPAPPRKVWPTLDAGGDLPTLMARLRAAGFPAEIIRAMIMAELSSRYDTRIRALFEPDPSTPFWKGTASSFLMVGDKRMEQYSQLQRERAKLQRELFADPFFATDDVTTAQRRQFGNLPRQKIDLLQRIEDDYAEMGAAIRSATNGILLADDRDKLALLSRERRADLSALLSPEELADYEMRSSPVTGMLTRNLGGFNASDAEYRAIFQAQMALSERLGPAAFSGGGNYEDRQAAVQQLNDRLKAALGATRYADYVRESDSTFQQLVRLVQRENLPADTALRAFNVRDTVAQESGRIADDATLTTDQKRAALQALADRTRSDLNTILGPNAGPNYVKVVDARWLSMVQRGNAVSFGGSSGSSMVGFSGTNSMPVALSFGLSPTFRNVAAPAAPPPRF